ncbi:helix-turn-helix domain-containing protein [Microvirga sp. STR05]|uniref:Helix-turn-helix domain-containing protein n=1 Tax=Hymenobacter duratus TaxID=2771356 RepID=A0ABR8JC72_9BACT|nr:helix-turn-helix domain-containing protein [Hymenobacter duratus]MBR7949270.1 helix-turn-helix domain-containing protein [Microvirga sp. STR05]
MYNPFEVLNTRLEKLEALITERLPINNIVAQAPELGGLALAQEVTRLSKARIYALVSARGIPHSKRGNKLYFSRSELLAWITAGNRAEQHKAGR